MASRKILLEWPDLQLKAYATLAEDQNPELCEELLKALPMDSIMNNAVITDGSMYCWLPMLSFAPIRVKERIDLAPIGRLRFSQNTGNKLIVQYSACNEDILGAVLGMVDPEYLDVIRCVGAAASESIFMTKRELHVRISRADEPAAENGEEKPSLIEKPLHCSEAVEHLASELLRLGLEASKSEPEEHKMVRTGQNAGMGSCGQYFSTWEFVYSLTRDLSMYTLYPFARMCRNELFSVRQLEEMYMQIDPTYTNLLGSYGMRTLRELARQFRGMIAAHTLTREEFRYIIDSFVFYTNMLAQWSYFYYPWGIGCACFRFDEAHKTYTPET